MRIRQCKSISESTPLTGPQFRELHILFEEQYLELADIEEVAEVPTASEMGAILMRGHEQVVRNAREILPQVQAAADESTAGLVSDRMRVHEKTAWMLRSIVS
jgi:starvation-inducible DNA-binding protein